MQLSITKYCHIKNNCFAVNGEKSFECETLIAAEFLTTLYRKEKIEYPKFFKMDNLSKLGFLAADLLLKNTVFYGADPKQTMSIVLANSSSSLDTDAAYQQTIGKEYFPSPSVFVYTLPNIVMGEIAIKHKILGENTFFIQEKFNADFIEIYVKQMFNDSDTQCAIVGWVDFRHNKYEAFLMLIEKTKKTSNFTKEIIEHLYNS